MRKDILKSIIVVCLVISACANQATSISTNAPSPGVTNEAVNTPSLGAHFPQTNNILGNTDMVVSGELTLENGCLRVSETNTINGDSFLLIWNLRFSTRTEDGVVQVIDSSTGKVLASAGDYVEVGGGIVVAEREVKMALIELIPRECPEPYWLVGDPIKKIDKP